MPSAPHSITCSPSAGRPGSWKTFRCHQENHSRWLSMKDRRYVTGGDLAKQLRYPRREASPLFSSAQPHLALPHAALSKDTFHRSVKVNMRSSSPSLRRSRSPRHINGCSCSVMPYLRVKLRSALTKNSVRILSSPIPSNANTLNPRSCMNPMRINRMCGFIILFCPPVWTHRHLGKSTCTEGGSIRFTA